MKKPKSLIGKAIEDLMFLDKENLRIQTEKIKAMQRGDNPSIYNASNFKSVDFEEWKNEEHEVCHLNPRFEAKLNVDSYLLHLQQ